MDTNFLFSPQKILGKLRDYYLSIVYFDIWATFGGIMGVATTCAPMGLGPQNPTKKLANLEVFLVFRSTIISKKFFWEFKAWTLPPALNHENVFF